MTGVMWLHSSTSVSATIVLGPPENSVMAPGPGQSLLPVPPASASRGLSPSQLAVVVNTADKLSVAIGDYYARKRHVPKANVIRVSFDPERDDLPEDEFANIRATAESRAGAQVQAYALTWARPYRVGCMSITSAFAFGFDTKYCAAGCKLTQPSPYFDAATSRPHDVFKIRPTMSIAALDFAHAKSLIDRGVQSDSTLPRGSAYLLATDDPARNVRAREYSAASNANPRSVKINVLHAEDVRDHNDVMFYFIGAANVPDIASNHFLPGAIADHLTSFGGMLTADSGQMSSLRWLEAGATGSYGTVVEPCNLLGKFPNVAVLMEHYLAGETLLEAYWKSVAMPGQGLFIGEPLAAPFRQ
jgi:uncharacterized protein (TIGR03790 family)